jgi:hypothetical protein
MPRTIQIDGRQVQLQSVVTATATVVASPTDNTETIIATLTVPVVDADQTVYFWGWHAVTVGTNGTACTTKIRRTDASGSTRATTGAVTAVAATLREFGIQGSDAPGAVQNQVYVMTLTVTAGSAASTVSSLALFAAVI